MVLYLGSSSQKRSQNPTRYLAPGTEPVENFVVFYVQTFLHLQPPHLEPGSPVGLMENSKMQILWVQQRGAKAESLRRHMESEPALEFRQVPAAFCPELVAVGSKELGERLVCRWKYVKPRDPVAPNSQGHGRCEHPLHRCLHKVSVIAHSKTYLPHN